ncbi:hypothetical protein SAMN04487866_11952 [Thermoactinomyces sp. DSM 45891]|uniref:DUF692 domain-containing protein n=1 Tax=Thermoactinomyces sp. DSM 45891 TaxID=1761907 RepID=UPI0009166501|nr:DUF692 domain-containing protein [Thermoactinomyces sp. DSM 45891]SFX71692.1 hypothetical protein SAMN04487866_11952 [Thermoactinomyces sp. DSM 45891]
MVKGVGVGLRSQFSHERDKIIQNVDFLEINFGSGVDYKEEFGDFLGKIPCVIHSVNLSLGSVEPPPRNRVDFLKGATDFLRPSWVSEHLSFSRNNDIEINNFIALPYTDEAIEIACRNISDLQSYLGVKVALENVTHSFTWSENTYTEAEFIKNISEKANCGLLLDVTNLHINSRVHGYDPYEFLENMPKDRVLQLHIAGHSEMEGVLYDTHVGGIHQEVLQYAEWVLQHTSCDAVVIERDNEINLFDDLISDINLCKELYNKYRR